MGGKFSRRKGLRGEYQLRDILRSQGYEANRVPSSGAAEGFKGDVKFSKEGKTWLAEVKLRGGEYFKRVYDFYDKYQESGIVGVAVGTPERLWCINVSADMESALLGAPVYRPETNFTGEPTGKYGIRKLITLFDLLGESDVLVVRHDRKPFLYIRYR